MNQNQTESKPTDAEQESGKGLDETPCSRCRGCEKELKGSRGYYYDPETMEAAKTNQYGGLVCSRQCDWNVSVGMASSFPGAGRTNRPDCYAMQKIRSNWGF